MPTQPTSVRVHHTAESPDSSRREDGEAPPPARLAPRAGGNRRWWLPAAGCLLLAGLAALSIDMQLARWLAAGYLPELLYDLFHLCEPFGNGLGVLVVLALLYQLDPPRRWALPRVATCAWGAGLSADVVKLLVERARPHSAELADGVWASFGAFLPGISAGSAGQSFPSAHTATAFGLAAALAWLYPVGRRAFFTLAALVALQRMASASHFLSDVCCGAAVGLVTARAVLCPGRLLRWFERIESPWKTLRKQPLPAGELQRMRRMQADQADVGQRKRLDRAA